MTFHILVSEGIALAQQVKHELSFIRSYHYTQASMDTLETATLFLDSAIDLLHYAEELQQVDSELASQKVQIACDAMKKVQEMLNREFDTNLHNETGPWFDKVSINVGAFA